jgi:hypothetical protein
MPQPDDPAGCRGADVLPFPTCLGYDLLIERLRGADGTLTRQSVAEWADPLDAAILAACLLQRPGAEIRRREEAADRAGNAREATFWHEAGFLLLAITEPADEHL